jgi:hypothetical protein
VDIIRQKTAKELGLPRYFTGKPCKNGHIAERITGSGHCTICAKEYFTKRYKNKKEELLAYFKRPDVKARCRARRNAARAANPGSRKEEKRKDYERHKERYISNSIARKISKKHRTPSWTDPDKILEVYKEAARLTKETGIPHRVDHIVPLQGKLVSGLHVSWNLQIITEKQNLLKSNKFDPDEYEQWCASNSNRPFGIGQDTSNT